MTLEAVDSGSLRSGRSGTSRPTQGWFRHNRSSIVRHLVINLFLVIIIFGVHLVFQCYKKAGKVQGF